MITLLKNLRRSLMYEHKLSKYLLYALGEIILVVMGILIALSINNWNERRKDEIQVANYLHSLRGALQEDIASLDASIAFNKTRLRGVFYILEHANLNTDTFTELEWVDISNNDAATHLWEGAFPDSLNRRFTNLAFSLLGRGFGGVSLNKSVVNELYSTGSFSNIENEEVKKKIANYYGHLAQRLEGFAIEEHEEWANETTRFLRDRYGIFSLDVSEMKDPFALIKDEKEVEHYLRYLALEINYHCIWAAQAISMARELDRLLEQEYGHRTEDLTIIITPKKQYSAPGAAVTWASPCPGSTSVTIFEMP